MNLRVDEATKLLGRQVIALTESAAHADEIPALLRVFDAFGNDRQPQRAGDVRYDISSWRVNSASPPVP